MKKSINIIGAFDRYNYGDLLFPIIIEEYLKKYDKNLLKDFQLEYYGLVNSDLTGVGGKKSKRIKDLYQKNIPDGSAVIISGGEVISSKNTNLYLHLCENYPIFLFKSFIVKGMRKIVGKKIIDSFFRKKFGIRSDYPWVIDPSHFNNEINIMYNTVGGRIPASKYDYLHDKLSKADYISVRENDVLNNINIPQAHLYPDSATMMSDIFPLEILEKKVSPVIRNFVNENKNYICIQTNLSIYKKNKEEYISQIKRIKSHSKEVKIVLLPLGYATNHDDRIGLRKIKDQIPDKVELMDELNIYEMMYIIGCSQFFAGTSLHGNITAMSYSVPHIGLSKDRPKLESYLSTWDIEEQNHCIEISMLYDYYVKSLNTNKELLASKRDELVNLVLENFQNLFKVLKEE
ncbi:hypothetical protein JCM14036_07470 [Desulfotomaculum defluvii]